MAEKAAQAVVARHRRTPHLVSKVADGGLDPGVAAARVLPGEVHDQFADITLLLSVDPSGDGQDECGQRRVFGQHASMISALTVPSGRQLTVGTVCGPERRPAPP